MKKKILITFYSLQFNSVGGLSQPTEKQSVWNVGKADNSVRWFALAPNGFKQFVGKDFGYEDKYFLVGYSKEKKDFPYVIPGPADTWGGTWPTAGWRTNQVNILFGLRDVPANGEYKLVLKVYWTMRKNFFRLLR